MNHVDPGTWRDVNSVWGHGPPGLPLLGTDEVHVWRAFLDVPLGESEKLWNTLAPDEQSRATRFRFQRDRDRFVVGRGLLRAIIGRYLDAQPSQLRFCVNSYGKPRLTGQYAGAGLEFNLSHAGALALYSVTSRHRVGVDLEQVGRMPLDMALAGRFFSPGEVAALRRLPPALRSQPLYHCWTRKEAYLKAVGKGLSVPLEQFEVTLTPGDPAALLSTAWDAEEAARWSMQELHPGQDYVGALCVEGCSYQLNCWQWPWG